MKLSEVMELSRAELSRMSGAELHSIVKSAAGSLNRRAQNIQYNRGASKIALEKVGFNRPGGRFGTAGTLSGGRYDRSALMRELDRMRDFYNSAQSTVKAARNYTKQIESKFETAGAATAEELDELRRLENEIYREISKQRQIDKERYSDTLDELSGGMDRMRGKDINAQIRELRDILDRARERTEELIGSSDGGGSLDTSRRGNTQGSRDFGNYDIDYTGGGDWFPW